ncbi:hypothetical protein chiPu_0026138, partial [Chiloscyllium punctatum]|nr:hypothetical protein [Chiloscyllium punctatum]
PIVARSGVPLPGQSVSRWRRAVFAVEEQRRRRGRNFEGVNLEEKNHGASL